MNSDMLPYATLLDVSVSQKKKIEQISNVIRVAYT
jgi:hypothetical protein